jgi:hypothetical protein
MSQDGTTRRVVRALRQVGLYERARQVRRGVARLEVTERSISMIARVSPTGAAALDWLQPSKHSSWGGPMNGQAGRQRLIRELVRIVDVAAVVETGTYRGTTTEFLWHLTGRPVFSVESERRSFEYAKRRFARNESVQLSLSDSRIFLQRLVDNDEVPKKTVLFYLDAHWGADLPLRDELVIIAQHWSDPIIVIDDFAVPGDPGYGFDDYGEGRSLTLDYLPPNAIEDMVVLFPSLPSRLETGARRGCAVLVERTRELDLSSLSLRHATVT